MGTNRFKNLAYNSPLENRFKGLEEESQNIQPTPIQQAVQPQVSPMAPIKRTETISQAPPLAPPKEPSMWNKIARTVLPKGVEDLFGMNDDRPLTGKERVEKGEDMSQNYFRGQRKEENITGVTAPVEQYTAPTTTGGRWKEVIENKGYIKNVWSGFIKPAIGTVSEQVGIQLDNPKIRQWGEQFADRVMEEERRRASAQSMADVAGPTDGGLGDPRFYSKTITQGLGFMTAIFGTSLLVTATTKNPIAGAVAGYAVGTGLESSGAYQTMIDDGVSPEDASPAAGIYGAIATVIENATGIRPAGGVKTLVKDFSVDAARDGAIKNFMKKWAQEGILEEGSQQLVENFVAKFVDENRGLFDGVLDSMISGAVGALPMVGGGAVIERNKKEIKEAIKSEEGFAKVPGSNTVKIDTIKTNLLPQVEAMAKTDTPKIKALEEIIKEGEILPAVPVYKEADGYVLNKDGFHRFTAYKNLGIEDIPVRVEDKTFLSSSAKQKEELAQQETTETTPETKSLFASAPEDSGKAQGYVPPIESPEAPTLQKQILAAKDAFDEQERSNSTPPDPIDFPDEVMSVRNAVANSPILQNMSEYKDIGQAKVHFRDWFRNTLQVFGEDKAAADEILFVPFVKSKDENIDFLKKETDELAANVPFGKDSKESKHIQLYGEGKITWEELVDKFREKKASQIRDADKFFRKKYDEFYARLNGVEQHIYPTSPHKWTPYRKDYYRHFYEVSNEFSRLQNILENPIRIDPLLVGKTEDTKPKSKWASFKQRRTGTETKEDAIGGYLDYMNSVSYAIHIDPHIGRIREFTDILRRGTAKNKNLNKYIQSLDNMANELSGKTPLLDRAWMEHLPGGRAGLAGMSWLNRRVKANTILMNVKSALSQILNVPQGVATAGPINSARGAVKAMGGVFVKNEALAKSPFMKERFFKGFQQFDKGVLANTKKFAAWMVTALDEAGSVIIWNGQYEKARNNGEANPIKVADDATRNLVGGRGIGEKPTIQNSDVFQIVAPFQYEMTNIWWIMEDMAKGDDELKKKMGQFMMLWIYMWLTNEIFEKVTGGRPLFDPIEAVKDGIEEIKVENNAKGWTKAVGRQAGEVVSNLPGGQFLGTAYPVYGFDIGGVEFPTREEFMGSGDPTRFGEGLLSTKALSDPLFKVAPPYGGGQIKKIWQGLNTLDDQASFTKNGSFQYKVDDGFKNYLTAILFGKYALPEAKEYYEERDKQKSSSGGSNRFNGL